MMPIYFNIESHLWIAYLFFINGYLAQLLCRRYSDSFVELTESLEAQVLAAFFLSIGMNGVFLYALDLAALPFSNMFGILGLLTVLLFFGCCANYKRLNYQFEISGIRLVLYLLIFIVLFYNGGLIEQISDAWWHMSLANKIGLANSYTVEPGHLTGAGERYYPPLWHANLALVNSLSSISIPVFWNSFTAWGAVIKVMAFYLFAYALSGDTRIGLLSACLFVLIPGVGNSYLRVSAWPSHIAYTAWFSTFYIAVILSKEFHSLSAATFMQNLMQSLRVFWLARTQVVCIAILIGLMLFTHQVELLWFALTWFVYMVGCSISRTFDSHNQYLGYRDNFLIRGVYQLALLSLMVFSLWFFYKRGSIVLTDKNLAYLLPFFCVLSMMISECLSRSKVVWRLIARLSFIAMMAVLLITFDYTHLLSLFIPELVLPSSGIRPAESIALLGGKLALPSWRHQLGEGLLYSGILSIVISWALVFYKSSRLTIFVASSATTVLLFCLSPYLYQWLSDVLRYHSTWRIALILFHPIILAAVFILLFDQWRAKP